jgi:hypothetical protein
MTLGDGSRSTHLVSAELDAGGLVERHVTAPMLSSSCLFRQTTLRTCRGVGWCRSVSSKRLNWHRSRRAARKRGLRTPLTGAVTFVQRFGGLVNLNVNYHLVVPDGVFVESDEGLRFEMLPVPTNANVLAILDRRGAVVTFAQAAVGRPAAPRVRGRRTAVPLRWAPQRHRRRDRSCAREHAAHRARTAHRPGDVRARALATPGRAGVGRSVVEPNTDKREHAYVVTGDRRPLVPNSRAGFRRALSGLAQGPARGPLESRRRPR